MRSPHLARAGSPHPVRAGSLHFARAGSLRFARAGSLHLAWASGVTDRYLRRGGNFWPVEPVLAGPRPPLVLSTVTRQDIHLAPRLTLTVLPLADGRTPVADRFVARYLRREATAGPGAGTGAPAPGRATATAPPAAPPPPAPVPVRGAVPGGGIPAPPPGYAPVPREVQRGSSRHSGGGADESDRPGPRSVPPGEAGAGASWSGSTGSASTPRSPDPERLSAELAQRLGDRLAGQLTERVMRGLDRRQLARWERRTAAGEGGVG